MNPPLPFSTYVAKSPKKAAALAVRGLKPGADPRDRERAEQVAVALRSADRCARCGRELSNPTSLRAGVGPECRRQMHGDPVAWREVRSVLEVLRDAGYPTLPLDELDALEPDLPPEET